MDQALKELLKLDKPRKYFVNILDNRFDGDKLVSSTQEEFGPFETRHDAFKFADSKADDLLWQFVNEGADEEEARTYGDRQIFVAYGNRAVTFRYFGRIAA